MKVGDKVKLKYKLHRQMYAPLGEIIPGGTLPRVLVRFTNNMQAIFHMENLILIKEVKIKPKYPRIWSK